MSYRRSIWLAACLALVSVSARADPRRLQVTVDVPPASEPTQLCVVGSFVPKAQQLPSGMSNAPRLAIPAGGSCGWFEGQAASCKSAESYQQQLESNGVCAPSWFQPSGEYVWCEAKKDTRERVLAIKVNSGVTSANLQHSLIQLVVEPTRDTKSNTITVDTVGGDYLPTTVATHRDPDGSDRALMRVAPRCAVSRVTIPRYECSGLQKSPELKLIQGSARALSVRFDTLADSQELPLPQGDPRGGSLELTDCGGSLVLKASWLGRPPGEITLKPRVFPVLWSRDPLSARDCPKALMLPEVPLRCPLRASAAPGSTTCEYRCDAASPVDLPTTVAFKEARVSQPDLFNTWEARLLQPGEKLDGYLRPEQRFITLVPRGWDPAQRPKRLGDSIDSIWIATPDGKTQFVSPTTSRLFVPGVSAGDSIGYRYSGDRLFSTKPAPVESGGSVYLDDPDGMYTRGVQPGVAVFGGWRYIEGATGAAEWNPVGGVELVFAVPRWRGYFANEHAFFEPELHLGALVTTQSYESIFQATPSDAPNHSTKNALILVVPIEASLRFALLADQLQWDIGGGIAWYRPFYAEDTGRLAPNIAVSLPHATALWRVTRAFTFGFDFRAMWGFEPFGLRNRRVVERFDLGGLVRREELGTVLLMFGPTLRFDDVF